MGNDLRSTAGPFRHSPVAAAAFGKADGHYGLVVAASAVDRGHEQAIAGRCA
jgi:hypothetical protein